MALKPEANTKSLSYSLFKRALIEDSFSLFSTQEQTLLSHLLPNHTYEKQYPNLTHRLQEYRFLLLSLRNALKSFVNGDFSDFDSLVGENSCQIRATMLQILIKYSAIDGEIVLDKVRSLIEKVDSYLPKVQNNLITSQGSLDCFLHDNLLHLTIDNKILFLLNSYILTYVRILLPPNKVNLIVRNENTKTAKLKEISNVGSSFCREVIKHLRSLLSRQSVQFIQDAASILLLPDSVYEMVYGDYVVDYNEFGHLKCLPCFWYSLILTKLSIKLELPILLTVKEMSTDENLKSIREFQIGFTVSQGKFVELDLGTLNPKEPILSVYGCACKTKQEFKTLQETKKEIIEANLENLILSYAAAHRQYPDATKDVIVEESANTNLVNYFKAYADVWGCSLNNPKLFFLVHVHTDTYANLALKQKVTSH